MSLFCLLWIPLFYLFRRSIFSGEGTGSGGILALLLGSLAALLQFFLGDLIKPGGFGFSRWLSACIDIVVVPALLPLLVYFLLTRFGILSGKVDYTNFALLWLIPGGAPRAASWSVQRDPILLVLVPLLWTVLAAGFPFCAAQIFRRRPGPLLPLFVLLTLGLPILAAAVYWAFFCQKLIWGYLLLLITLIPLALSCKPNPPRNFKTQKSGGVKRQSLSGLPGPVRKA